MINQAFQGRNPTVRERFNECFNNPNFRYLAVALSWASCVGAGSVLFCTAKENAVPPTNQCIIAEMPKFFAYASSGLGILAGSTYVLTNFCRLRDGIQRAVRVGANPQVDLGNNSQNGRGEAPPNSTRNPQQGNVPSTQDVSAEIGVVRVNLQNNSTTDSSPRQPSAGPLQVQSSPSIVV